MKLSISESLACAALAIGVAASSSAIAADDPAFYFEDQCVDCHHTKKKPIEDKHLSREEWKKAIDKMLELEKLDPVPTSQFISVLLDWLAKTHGPTDTAVAPPAPTGDAAKSQ